MFVKHYIAVILIILSSALAAEAQASCQMIDKVLKTVSLLTDIETETKDQHYRKHITELSNEVSEISLPSLIPIQNREHLKIESGAALHYISRLREGVSAAQAGNNDFAKEIFNDSLTPEFFRSLESLDSYWRCRESDVDNLTDDQGAENESQFFGAGSRVAKSNTSGVESRLAKVSDTRGNLTNGRETGQVAFNPTTFKKANVFLSIILAACVIIGGFLFFQYRVQKFEVRQIRHPVNLPVKVRIKNNDLVMLIVDLSMNGAKIKHSTAIEGQKILRIHLGETWHVCNIKWSNDNFIGVMFKTPIESETIRSII